MTPTIRADYRLSDNLEASHGTVFLTGTQALIRLLAMQSALDKSRGMATQGFLSGYRGSPLGGVDRAAWQAKTLLADHSVRFLPAINEELAATAVLGTQRVESDPLRTADGVFAMWYGKGPGVDRAGDALKHGHAYGSSPHGGVLVVAGDDHGCVSSSMPHQSDQAFMAWRMPIVAPGSVSEYLAFGLYGWALSRFSGSWVAMTALSEVVESAASVDLDQVNAQVGEWVNADEVQRRTAYQQPPDGLHYRWPDLPSVRIEERLLHKLDAVRTFARVNSIDREVITSAQAHVGIVTVGKAHGDVMEVFRLLGLSERDLAEAGVRLYKLGLIYPIEPVRMCAFASGLTEILVVEEKAPVVESQMRDLFYNLPGRPVILGKRDKDGALLLPELAELRPSRLAAVLAPWLARHARALDRRHQVLDFLPLRALSNAGDSMKRLPYFCAGCPHNTSTKVPEGSRAQAGIGCHFMASWMDRETSGLIQMGGEGVDWVSHSQYTRAKHVFQNLGDGTYYHSGLLAIRQAVAAGTNITYKVLFNDAVAMTGGQPVDGILSVDRLARQVEAEGAARVVVVSDHIDLIRRQQHSYPQGTRFHDRADLEQVQRELREVPGVTVLIYQQTCAAELRRHRKAGRQPEPQRHVFINEAVCEGCSDCSVQSNCVAVVPKDTTVGRKRRIDQGACNKDYSCTQGFCPSFVSVKSARIKQRTPMLTGKQASHFDALVAALPLPGGHDWATPYELLVTGVGGTGVVTVGAVIAMAAHLEGKFASVLDFMGFAQKGGAVLSFVRIADQASKLHQARIDAQQAHAVLACDLVVAASPDALNTMRRGQTRVAVNMHETPVAQQLMNPDTPMRTDELLDKLRYAAGPDRLDLFDAHALAERFLGDALGANILALGYAWQRGLVPLSLAALMRAIELNGVAVQANLRAFAIGRLQAGNPAACNALLTQPQETAHPAPDLDTLIAQSRQQLRAYQSEAYAHRFASLIDQVKVAELALPGHAGQWPLATAVARNLLKLMMYKDEYEVARLYTNGAFDQALREQFDGPVSLEFHMAPPIWIRWRGDQAPRKIKLGPWLRPLLSVLAKGKVLRGTIWDVFGRTEERRMERDLIRSYEQRILDVLPLLTPERLVLAIQVASIPQSIRGFGHIKETSVVIARAREAELLHRLDPQRYPRPLAKIAAGQFKGIAITSH